MAEASDNRGRFDRVTRVLSRIPHPHLLARVPDHLGCEPNVSHARNPDFFNGLNAKVRQSINTNPKIREYANGSAFR